MRLHRVAIARALLVAGLLLLQWSACVCNAADQDDGCSLGKYRKPNFGPNVCFLCPSGMFCVKEVLSPCPENTYNPELGASECRYLCADHSTSPKGSVFSSDCTCDNGYVRIAAPPPIRPFDPGFSCLPDVPPSKGVNIVKVAIGCCALSASWLLNNDRDAIFEIGNITVPLDLASIRIEAILYLGDIALDDVTLRKPAGKIDGTFLNGSSATFAGLSPLTLYTLHYRVYSSRNVWSLPTVAKHFRTLPAACSLPVPVSVSIETAAANDAGCPAGTYIGGCESGVVACVLCPAGTFGPAANALVETACRICPPGTYSHAGAVNCSAMTLNSNDCSSALAGSVTSAPVCWASPDPRSAFYHIPGIPTSRSSDVAPALEDGDAKNAADDNNIGVAQAKIALPAIYGGVLLFAACVLLVLIYAWGPMRRLALAADILYRLPDRDVHVTESLGVPEKVPSLIRSSLSVVAFLAIVVVWAYATHDFVRNRYVEERTVVTLSNLGIHAYESVTAPRIYIAALGTPLACDTLVGSVRPLTQNIFDGSNEPSKLSVYTVTECVTVGEENDFLVSPDKSADGNLFADGDMANCMRMAMAAGSPRCLRVRMDPVASFHIASTLSLLVGLSHVDGAAGPWPYAQTLRVRLESPSWLTGATSWASVSIPLGPSIASRVQQPLETLPPGFGVSAFAAFLVSRALLITPSAVHTGYELTIVGPASHIPDPIAAGTYNASAGNAMSMPTPAALGMVVALNLAPTVVQIRQLEVISPADLATRLISYAAAVISAIGVCVGLSMRFAQWRSSRRRTTDLVSENTRVGSRSGPPTPGKTHATAVGATLCSYVRRDSWTLMGSGAAAETGSVHEPLLVSEAEETP